MAWQILPYLQGLVQTPTPKPIWIAKFPNAPHNQLPNQNRPPLCLLGIEAQNINIYQFIDNIWNLYSKLLLLDFAPSLSTGHVISSVFMLRRTPGLSRLGCMAMRMRKERKESYRIPSG